MHEAERRELILELAADRFRAHQLLFPHRHPHETPYAHRELCDAIYAPHPRQSVEGFRGVGKSTWLEEAAVLRACFGEFRNKVIVGSSYERACERLIPIKHELLYNDKLIEVFGRQQGKPWHEGKIVLKSGVCIQALGRDQAMTGIKHGDWRPDAALVDDVEDPEEVRTDENREQTWNWFLKTFLPSLDHLLYSWVRVLGTRRGRGSLPERLQKAGWPTLKLPIEFLDGRGDRQATWPGKFPLGEIDEIRKLYRGDMHTYMQEFMCEAVSEADRTFGTIRVYPRPRTWQAVDAMYDPARSTTRRSATTGWAVGSWFGSKLVVWDGGANRWQPSELIDHMFKINREHHPRWLGIEEDGLNEWAKQPIRAEMARRRELLPLLPVRAPRDRNKINFISGALQPFFSSGDIEFAKELPELQDQLLSFPTGDIDGPNALALLQMLKPGLPVYDNFGEDNIVEGLSPIEGRPLYLAGNADGSLVTAALLQRAEGEIRILADWVREGSPSELVAEIHAEAAITADTGQWTERLEYGQGEHQFKLPVTIRGWSTHPIRWIVPGIHQERYVNVGLVQAIRAIPQGVSVGERDADRGHAALGKLLASQVHGRPRLLVSPLAQWTLRAFAGGYSRGVDRRGLAAAQADSGIYRLLMEGIESFCALGSGMDQQIDQQPIAHTRSGVAYRSAIPERRVR